MREWAESEDSFHRRHACMSGCERELTTSNARPEGEAFRACTLEWAESEDSSHRRHVYMSGCEREFTPNIFSTRKENVICRTGDLII